MLRFEVDLEERFFDEEEDLLSLLDFYRFPDLVLDHQISLELLLLLLQ